MTDLATLKSRLAEAEAQYHQVSLKGSITQTAFSLGGQNAVQRAAVDPVKLQAYIQDLKMQIARQEGGAGRMRQVTW
ncbi:hypothetical protein [Devosia faecipullorum]|uniref:hypothetical protein n=1 Tax=Devosia faecipullorum TaxID=2755039 RepID=UPI00187B744F|nr:hypothetical protein [Devosia faecipullorum]MBE7732163.1 hypothetical protein [Devosia faecipullorum]